MVRQLFMQPIAYTISPYLIRYLSRIESLRQQIILYPLSPQRELGLQFQATVDRVHFGLSLTDEHVHRDKIKAVLANQIVFAMQKKPFMKDSLQNSILRYKQSLDYIKREWNLSYQSISVSTLIHLY